MAAQTGLVHLALLDGTDEHHLPARVRLGQRLQRVDVQAGIVETDHAQTGLGNGGKVGGHGKVGLQGAIEDLHVGGVEDRVGVRIDGEPGGAEVLGGGDDQVRPAGEFVVVSPHHLRVDESRKGRVLVDAVIDHQRRGAAALGRSDPLSRSGAETIDQGQRRGQIGPEDELPIEPDVSHGPLDVLGQHGLVHAVDAGPHVPEGQHRRRGESPQTRVDTLERGATARQRRQRAGTLSGASMVTGSST